MPVSMRLVAPLILLTTIASVPAAAQPARPPATTTVTRSGPATGWNKLCSAAGPTQACAISQEMFSEQGQFIASASFQYAPGGGRRRLIVNVPLGMWIEDGIQIRVDQGQVTRTHFGTCMTNGCFGAIDVNDALLNQMRRGRILQIIVRPPDPQVFQINIPLEAFGTAYDGAPAEPAAVQTRISAFYADMQQRAASTSRPQQPPATPAPRQ